jgi:hypothetical protein
MMEGRKFHTMYAAYAWSRARPVGFLIGAVLLVCVACTGVSAASPPDAEFNEPINASAGFDRSTNITVTDGELVISGEASDEDGISHLTIAREFTYHDDEDDGRGTEVDRYYATPEASNGTFRHTVPLGTGTNEVNISVVDNDGAPAKLDVVVTVEDTEKPTTKRLSATPDGDMVRIEGWIDDNVQVAAVRVGGQTVDPTVGLRDLGRGELRIEQAFPRPDGETVTVRVVDEAGNVREVVLPIGGPAPTATPIATPTETPRPTATATPTGTPTTTDTATPTVTATTTTTRTPADARGGGGVLGWVISVVALLGVLALVSQVTGGGW